MLINIYISTALELCYHPLVSKAVITYALENLAGLVSEFPPAIHPVLLWAGSVDPVTLLHLSPGTVTTDLDPNT